MDNRTELRLKSNGNGGTNLLRRVSIAFAGKLEAINDKREENGFDRISIPKMTELIIRHNTGWNLIERDLIYFNTALEEQEELINVQ